MKKDASSPLVSHYVRIAAGMIDGGKELLIRLEKPDNEIEKKISFAAKNGEKTVSAYRVQHNNFLGPYKGGLRFHPDVTIEEFATFAFLMTLKGALLAIPFGGGKGGIKINPKELSGDELESLSRSYMRAFADSFGPHKDIPAPDVNTNPQVMAWMLDEYEEIVGNHAPAVITGKPLVLGGSKGRTKATGYGGAVMLNEYVKRIGKKPKDLTVAVQGFGNVGYFVAKTLSQMGYHIVALSDSKGGIVRNGDEGFDIETVLSCKQEQGYIAGCYCVGGVCDARFGKVITNEELLELDVDVLVPSALENVIHEKNAESVRASIVLEMANSPITLEADKKLIEKGVTVIPDILANAGGVTTSYFEWVQGNTGYFWDEKEVIEKLEKKMLDAFDDVYHLSRDKGLPLRTASYLAALTRLSKAFSLRGNGIHR